MMHGPINIKYQLLQVLVKRHFRVSAPLLLHFRLYILKRVTYHNLEPRTHSADTLCYRLNFLFCIQLTGFSVGGYLADNKANHALTSVQNIRTALIRECRLSVNSCTTRSGVNVKKFTQNGVLVSPFRVHQTE